MSTLLASLAVVAAAFCILWIALGDPDQPATARPETHRGRRRFRRRDVAGHEGSAAPSRPEANESGGAERPAGAVTSKAAASSARTRRRPRGRAREGAGLRARSALTLVVLVAFVGVLLAVAVGAALTLAAEALREAVG